MEGEEEGEPEEHRVVDELEEAEGERVAHHIGDLERLILVRVRVRVRVRVKG